MSSGTTRLRKLLAPRSIAAVGGQWAANVIEQALLIGFEDELWPVHPTKRSVHGIRCYRSVADLPAAPDACFIGVNRFQTLPIVEQLAARGAGGAVCFASGFDELDGNEGNALSLQERLVAASGTMPLLGPNCYGFVNYLDGVCLWPDLHGGGRCESGVALVAQSSNIAINLTMQLRGLPLACVVTVGNQAAVSIGEAGTALLQDDRVSALGLYIEGFGNVRAFEQMAELARQLNKPVVAIKAGRSAQSQQVMMSHTSSLAGNNNAADVFLKRLGIARVDSLDVLLETLKLLHVHGALPCNTLQSLSCSGGEAALVADAVSAHALELPALDEQQCDELQTVLGPLVALANPLDYHTFIWNDPLKLAATFTAMLRRPVALSLLVIDMPRGDCSNAESWQVALAAWVKAAQETGSRTALLVTLNENLSDSQAQQLIKQGVVPLLGVNAAIAACAAASFIGTSRPLSVVPVLQPDRGAGLAQLLGSETSHRLLEAHDVITPRWCVFSREDPIIQIKLPAPWPLVLKGNAIAHKTELDAVALDLQSIDDIRLAVENMPESVSTFILEEQITGAVMELLVGFTADPVLGFLLTVGAGGTDTELHADAAHALLPVNEKQIAQLLRSLRFAPKLYGYRGQPAVSEPVLIEAIMRLQKLVFAHHDRLVELEINPLIVTTDRAVVADVLITMNGAPNDT